ncbi:MAG: hypothetical protein JWO78_1888 [Micavibrio sp.]|nr:hypothetical protein [Micavibrio sp.]
MKALKSERAREYIRQSGLTDPESALRNIMRAATRASYETSAPAVIPATETVPGHIIHVQLAHKANYKTGP